MISAVDIKVYGGYYEIVSGMDFGVSSETAEFVTYEHGGVWYVRGDECRRKVSQTLIVLPYDMKIRRFSISVYDGAFKIEPFSADKVIIDANNSSGEVSLDSVGELRLDVGRGTLRANIKKSDKTCVECGSGKIDLLLGKTDGGYSITSKHGIGSVSLNSIALPRDFNKQDGSQSVSVVCGMGCVNLYT